MVAEQIAQAPLYLDWVFWSLIVSLLAVVLSQLPPIHILLRKPKLEAEAYSQMHITHMVGNPNASLHLILSNTGGRILKIQKIELLFKRGNQDEFSLPAKNYYQLPGDKETLLLTSFKLKPEEEWAHIINFVNFFSREDDKLFRRLESNLRTDILDKCDIIIDKNEMVTADEANVLPLAAFFDKKFRWLPGEYELTLRVHTNPPNIFPDKHFRFVLFESDSEELSGYKDDYKYGFGVSMNTPKHQGVFVTLSEA